VKRIKLQIDYKTWGQINYFLIKLEILFNYFAKLKGLINNLLLDLSGHFSVDCYWVDES